MQHTLSLTLEPEIALDDALLRQYIQTKHLNTNDDGFSIRKVRQSIDARKGQVKINLDVEIYSGEIPPPEMEFRKEYPDVSHKPQASINYSPAICGLSGLGNDASSMPSKQ